MTFSKLTTLIVTASLCAIVAPQQAVSQALIQDPFLSQPFSDGYHHNDLQAPNRYRPMVDSQKLEESANLALRALKLHSVTDILEKNDIDIETIRQQGCPLNWKRYDEVTTNTSLHRYFHFYCGSSKIFSAHLAIHNSLQGRGHQVWQLDWFEPDLLVAPDTDDYVQTEDLDAIVGHQKIRKIEKGYAAVENELVPVYKLITTDKSTGQLSRWMIDRRHGAVYESLPFGFAFAKAKLFTDRLQQMPLEEVNLDGLAGQTYLDGDDFQIIVGNHSPRVSADADGFFYAAPGDSYNFDQIQTYYNLTRAKQWFSDRFGFTDDTTLIAKTNTLIFGSPNNALYDPSAGPGEPRLLFGSGTAGVIENLSRDFDVAMHEYAHHIIYRRISNDRGDAASLHEGFADYFTYAFTGVPKLAPTVLPDNDHLRSAILAADRRYDNPKIARNAHNIGEIWSAMLWQLREMIGGEFDSTVYHSLNYLGPNSSFDDAIGALILADADHYQIRLADTQGASDNRCTIVDIAILRGFSSFLANIDGSPCNLDLQVIADNAVLSDEPDYRGRSGTFLARQCGVTNRGNSSQAASVSMILMLLMPLTLALLSNLARKTWN